MLAAPRYVLFSSVCLSVELRVWKVERAPGPVPERPPGEKMVKWRLIDSSNAFVV